MLNGISWKQFLEGIALLLFVYYTIVIFLYFRKGFTKVLLRQPVGHALKEAANATGHDPLLPQVHELVTGIKNVLYASASQQYAWNETIFALQQLLREFPLVHGSRFTLSINNEITHLSNEILGIPMSDEELQSLWVA